MNQSPRSWVLPLQGRADVLLLLSQGVAPLCPGLSPLAPLGQWDDEKKFGKQINPRILALQGMCSDSDPNNDLPEHCCCPLRSSTHRPPLALKAWKADTTAAGVRKAPVTCGLAETSNFV